MIVFILFIFIKRLKREKKQTNKRLFLFVLSFSFSIQGFLKSQVVFDQASKLTKQGVHHCLKPLTQQTTTENTASKTAV